MKAGWKNRIEERRYFEEKREKQKRRAKLNQLMKTLKDGPITGPIEAGTTMASYSYGQYGYVYEDGVMTLVNDPPQHHLI